MINSLYRVIAAMLNVVLVLGLCGWPIADHALHGQSVRGNSGTTDGIEAVLVNREAVERPGGH